MSIEQLLEHWAKLEPERYGHKRSPLRERYVVEGGRTHFFPTIDSPLLLAAVIEAVTARGWSLDLEIEPKGVLASVYTNPPDWHLFYYKTHEHPTHAALAVYVKALEGQAEA